MSYYYARTVSCGFDEAIEKVTEALKEQGFGVLTTIDVSGTLKKKLGVDVPRQTILGACNPNYAHQALQMEPHLGVLLPCNVVVRETDAGVEVAAVDAKAMLGVVGNTQMNEVAETVNGLMQKAVDAV